MNEQICPKCRVIYTNGQRECEECGKLLRNATEEDLKDFEKKKKKTLNKSSAFSASEVPSKEHIIASIISPLYSLVMGIFFNKAFLGLTFWNLFLSVISYIPRFKILIVKNFITEDNKLKLKRTVKFEHFYYNVPIIICLIINGIFNLFFTVVNIEQFVK